MMRTYKWLSALPGLLRSSLKTKLLIALFAIGFLPYLFIMLYTLNWGQEKIIQSITQTQYAQVDKIKHDVEQQMASLKREVTFLSQLEVMDDMVVGDIDKRISRLLMQKKRDMNLDLELLAVNPDNTVIASSSLEKLQQPFHAFSKLKKAISAHKTYFYDADKITLFRPIKASFDDKRQLGYLMLEYRLNDLNRYNLNQHNVRSVLINASDSSGAKELQQATEFRLLGDNGDYVTDEDMVLYEELDGSMKGWYAVYMIKKSSALAFLDDFILFLGVMFLIGLFLIALLSYWVSNQIVKPLVTLSKTAEQIVATEDYNSEVEVQSADEIGHLSEAFNAMVRQTKAALKALEEENRFRLQRFVLLIEIFNRIVQTQSEKECIETTLSELKKFLGEHNFRFTRRPAGGSDIAISLYVKDYDKQEQHYYGAIVLQGHTVTDHHEAQFYASVGTMIMLQLDQIRLIKQTREVSRAKSVFISHMSHELRTPLHAIITSSQYLITYGKLDDEQLRVAANVEASAQHLLSMINDILEMAKIEAGKVPVEIVSVTLEKLEPMFMEVMAMLEPLAEEKEIVMNYRANSNKKLAVETDIRLLKQILINLLSNAIKFTENGMITFSVEASGEEMLLRIKDTGIGIEEKDMPQIFNEFTQVGNTHNGKHQGSGLGLSLSRKLARLIGGDITILSKGAHNGTEAIVSLRYL
ncbi:HAMP domain-containing protein [bacterium]|nr:HAMP domain-containing protein [bacterium]